MYEYSFKREGGAGDLFYSYNLYGMSNALSLVLYEFKRSSKTTSARIIAYELFFFRLVRTDECLCNSGQGATAFLKLPLSASCWLGYELVSTVCAASI